MRASSPPLAAYQPSGNGAAAPDGAALDPEVTAAVLDALRAVGRELRTAERREEQRVGLPPAQVHTLRQLADRPARSLAELAERMHTDPSSASVVVQRLVERGLVARTPAADDRRRTELGVTAAGRALLRRAPTASSEQIAEALGRIGEKRAASLARGLERFAQALRRGVPDAEER